MVFINKLRAPHMLSSVSNAPSKQRLRLTLQSTLTEDNTAPHSHQTHKRELVDYYTAHTLCITFNNYLVSLMFVLLPVLLKCVPAALLGAFGCDCSNNFQLPGPCCSTVTHTHTHTRKHSDSDMKAAACTHP